MAAFGGPVKPPIRNTMIAPSTKSIGVGVSILPRQRVATHEKNLTPVGTATRSVLYMNGTRRYSFMPEGHMWCGQTVNPTSAIPREDMATQRYPNNGLRTNTGRSSEITPRPG